MKFLILILLSISIALAGPREEAMDLLSPHSQELDIKKRMHLFSEAFYELPYDATGPLGEGPEGRYDQDPLYRFDTFDCTTFVETVISLALSHDVEDFEKTINAIRYRNGEVDYMKRNHFPSLQWIPFNVENGLLEEINQAVLPSEELMKAEAIINIPGWLRSTKLNAIKVPYASKEEKEALLEELHLLADTYTPESASLSYIPISKILRATHLLKRIPDMSVVNFVRPNWDLRDVIGTHMNVSHQGLLFWEGNTLMLRHASSGGEKKVVEIPFLDYLKKYDNHPSLKGIHLMGVRF